MKATDFAELKSLLAMLVGWALIDATISILMGILFPPMLILTIAQVFLSVLTIFYLGYKRYAYISEVAQTDHLFPGDEAAISAIPLPPILQFFHTINFILISPLWLLYKGMQWLYKHTLGRPLPPLPHTKEYLIQEISKVPKQQFKKIPHLTQEELTEYQKIIEALEDKEERSKKLTTLKLMLDEKEPLLFEPVVTCKEPIMLTYVHHTSHVQTYDRSSVYNILNHHDGKNPVIPKIETESTVGKMGEELKEIEDRQPINYIYNHFHIWEVGFPLNTAKFITEVKETLAAHSMRHSLNSGREGRWCRWGDSESVAKSASMLPPSARNRPFFNSSAQNQQNNTPVTGPLPTNITAPTPP